MVKGHSESKPREQTGMGQIHFDPTILFKELILKKACKKMKKCLQKMSKDKCKSMLAAALFLIVKS